MNDAGAQRGQTESIGVILLTAIVIIGVGAFGSFYLGTLDPGGEVNVDLGVRATPTELSVDHRGGDALPSDEVVIIVRPESGSETRYSLSEGTLTGSTPETFDPGETWARTVSFTAGDRPQIFVVHNGTESVLFDSRVTVRAPTPTATPAPAYEPPAAGGGGDGGGGGGGGGDGGDGGDGGGGGGGDGGAAVIDDFEDNDIFEYTGSTNQFETVSSPNSGGTYALSGVVNGNSKSISSTSGLSAYPQAGESVTIDVQFSGTQNDGPSQIRTTIGTDSGQDVGVELNREGNNYALQVFNGGTSKRIEARQLNPGEWYEITIVWNDQNDKFTAELRDRDGNVLIDDGGKSESQLYVTVNTMDEKVGFTVTSGTAYWDEIVKQ